MFKHYTGFAVIGLIGFFISPVQSQQQFGIAVGNNGSTGGGDIIKREYYEYNPAGGRPNQRHAGPFDGLIPGFIIVVASSALQWYNEGRAVRDAKLLSKAEQQVVELDSLAPFDEKNDGKLIHLTGYISTDQGLTDLDHGLYRPNALQLTRTTEAYEWKETKSESRRRVSETETKVEVSYRYNKQWTKRHIESNRFQSTNHYNPYPMYGLGSNTMTVTDARVSNGLLVPPDLVNQISSSNNFWNGGAVSAEARQIAKPVRLGDVEGLTDTGNAVIVSNENKLYFSQRQDPSELLAAGISQPGIGYKSNIPVVRSLSRPDVGDVKVSWIEVTAPKEGVSILAKQLDGTLVPWSHDNNGHYVYSLFPGKFSAKSMITHLVGRSKSLTKILRIGGLIGNFIGLNIFLSCIPALAKLLPFGLGGILEPLVSIATSTIAFGVSIGLSFSVISVAWLRFRPLFATALALVSGAGFFGPYYYARSKRSAEVFEMDDVLKADSMKK